MLKISNKNVNRNTKGFTLIELLVVIFIIGLLASLSAGVAMSYRNRAKDGRIEATLSQIRKEAALILNESAVSIPPGMNFAIQSIPSMMEISIILI